MRRGFDLYNSHYSTLNVAGFGLMTLLAWGMLSYLGFRIPSWVWWSSLMLTPLGVMTYFLTRRLLIVRVYQFSGMCITSLAFGMVFWAALTSGQPLELTWLIGMAVALTLAITAVGAYYHNKSRLAGRTRNPVGVVGTLDARTARINRENDGLADNATEATNESVNRVLRFGPVIAGLSLLFTRSLSADGVTIVTGVVAFVAAYGAALGIGGMWYYTVKALNWQREHGKRIYVQR